MTKVYVIECVENGFAYVGCTRTDERRRMREHRSYLNRGVHSSKQMIEDWRKYGDAAFKLRVVEILPDGAAVDVRREAELRWMNQFSNIGKLYNVHQVSFGPCGDWLAKGHTPEANLKRRLAQLGKPKGHGAKISATKRALGQRPSLEAARMGGIAATAKRYAKSGEIV